MLEKIKKLLDSGCWVEVMYKPVEDGAEFMDKIIAYSSEDVFDRLINWRGDLFYPDLDCITSIKPIARPLYKYTIGQFVVILDNYEGDTFEIGKEYMVVGQVQGNVNLTKDKTINETFPVDVRCVAPLFDNVYKKMKKSDGNLIVREKIEMLNDQIDELAELFANKYFKDNPEFFFVGTGMTESRLGTVCVSDMYFGVRDIILALWYDVSWDDLEERYWAVADERTKMNLRSFLRKKGYTNILE